MIIFRPLYNLQNPSNLTHSFHFGSPGGPNPHCGGFGPLLPSAHMKKSFFPTQGSALLACMLSLTAIGCNPGGGASNEELNGLKTQVASLERDVTQLKQMFQSMTSVMQQQEATLRTLAGGGAKKGAAHTAPSTARAPAPAAPRSATPAAKKKAHR